MAIPGAACVDRCDAPTTFALMAIGGGVGFGSVLALTSLLPKKSDVRAPPVMPYASPLPNGGVQFGLSGML